MLKLTQRIDTTQANNQQAHTIYDTLTLPYELRMRGRLKAVTDNGREVGLFLDRGPVIRHGDLLRADSGEVIEVFAAAEPVATAYIENGLPIGRLCYHLGNRHTPLAIGMDSDSNSDSDSEGSDKDGKNDNGNFWVRFAPDHVLEELASLLGATVVHHNAPFDPESGAYAHAGREQAHSSHSHHSHEHSDNYFHGHAGSHSHSHSHSSSHSQSLHSHLHSHSQGSGHTHSHD